MRFNKDKWAAGWQTFFGKVLRRQYTNASEDGLESLMYFIESDEEWDNLGTDRVALAQVAYFLATIGWETGWTFLPVVEKRASSRQPDIKQIQDRYWHTGYYGRGYIQLTWKDNYEKMGKVVGLDLVRNKDKVIEPSVSYAIASEGMRKGLFRRYKDGSQVKLSDYINDNSIDFVNARNVVNGDTGKNGRAIAEFAKKILNSVLSPAWLSNTESVDAYDSTEIITASPNLSTDSAGNNSTGPATEPWKKPVLVTPTAPKDTTGPRSIKAIITTILSTAGLSITSVIGKVEGWLSDPSTTWIIITLIAGIFLLASVYVATRIYIKNKREERAWVLDQQRIAIFSNPNMYNVELDATIQ